MANDTIVRVTADASGYSAEMDKAKRSAASFLQTQEQAAQRTKVAQAAIAESAKNGADASARQIAAFVSQTAKISDAAGKTRSELLEQKAAQLGVTDSVAGYIAKIKASEAGTVNLGMSAKQTANAMRLIPMQMTDIVTQLAGGQNPLLILTQQGGQLKDVFGGVGPALRGVGTYIVGLVNPVTVAVAALGALVVAYQMGLKESERFNASLIMTGGYIGQTSGGLSAMAKSIGDTVGTNSKAADALNQIAASGKITGDNIKEIGTAAVAMEQATGQAVKQTVEEFVKLGEEPAKAIAKLNESQHFLTAAVYEQITALEVQGRKEDAAALAQGTWSTALQQRSNEVIGSVGLMEKAWKGLWGTVTSTWSAMATGVANIGKSDLHTQLADAEKALSTLENGYFKSGPAKIAAQKAVIDGIKAQIAAQDEQAKSAASQQAIEARGIAAQVAVAKQREQSASKTEQLNKALEDYRKNIEDIRKADPNSAFLDAAKIANDEKNIREKFKEPAGKAFADDAATRMLLKLKEQEAALNAQLVTSGKLGTVKAELAKFEQQIADIKGKSVLTADQKSLIANEGQLRAQLQKNAAVEQEITLKKEAVKIDALRQSLEASLVADQQQYGERLAATGLGRKAEEELRARQRIVKDYQRQLEHAGRDQLTGAISSETYQQEIILLQQNLDARLEAQGRYYDSLRTLQSDWRVGAASALADYADMAANVAQSTAGAFSNAFKGMEDAFVSFITKGKADFASLADSIISDMVRIAVQQSITGPLAAAMGNLFGGTPATGNLTGSSLSGASWGQVLSLDSGGYTGPGGKYEPAGIVHKGEYVLNQNATQRMGVGMLDRINKGYANGGLVGGGASAGGPGAPVVNIINNSSQPVQAKSSGPTFNGKEYVTTIILTDWKNNGPIRQTMSRA